MTGTIIHPDGSMSSSKIRIPWVLKLNSYELYLNDRLYLLFYDASSRDSNKVVSKIIGRSIYGPVIVLQKHNYQYRSPSVDEIRSLSGAELKQRDGCTIL